MESWFVKISFALAKDDEIVGTPAIKKSIIVPGKPSGYFVGKMCASYSLKTS